MKRISVYASMVLLSSVIVFTGCGGGGSGTSGSSSSASSSSGGTRSVAVVDGYVIGATVSDCMGTTAITNEHGIATAIFAPSCPLESQGGTIDADGNGVADTNEIPALNMHAPAGSDVISNITELLYAGADATKLAALLGINEADLYTDPIATNNVALAKANQIAYAVEVSGKTNDFVLAINGSASSSSEEGNGSGTDLPNIGHYGDSESSATSSSVSSSSSSSVSSSSSGDLPGIGQYNRSLVRGDLPGFGYGDSESSATSSSVSSSSSSSVSSSSSSSVSSSSSSSVSSSSSSSVSSSEPNIESFAAVARSLFSDGSLQAMFIDAIMALDITNVSELEPAIFTIKKDLYQSQVESNTTSE